jgi:hypothetical protein
VGLSHFSREGAYLLGLAAEVNPRPPSRRALVVSVVCVVATILRAPSLAVRRAGNWVTSCVS